MVVGPRDDPEDTQTTLSLLEVRLRRLEFLLSGSADLDGYPSAIRTPAAGTANVLARLSRLEKDLNKVSRSDSIAGEIISDIEAIFARHPELRKDLTSASLRDRSTQASIVLANATLFPEIASRLVSLDNLQIPPAESSAKLTSLRNNLQKCVQDQDVIDQEVQDLRKRSAHCLEWWIKTGVVGMGDLWEEWEYRMHELERQVARSERQQKDQEGYI